MCILTAEQEAGQASWLKVLHTDIFARHTRPGYQAIAYRLQISSTSSAAMILPLPVAPGGGDDALRFIDLSGYREFFDRLAVVCEPELECLSIGDIGRGADEPAGATLVVHKVGDFEASYVPSMADFARLDPRFRLPDSVWQQMPDYADYGFAVFQLRLGLSKDEAAEVENDVQPMAFEFQSRDPLRLFYPTVHVHDGAFYPTADFRHRLYCQREHARSEFKRERDRMQGRVTSERDHMDVIGAVQFDWYFPSGARAGECMPTERCQGLLDPTMTLACMDLSGNYPNRDIWLGG